MDKVIQKITPNIFKEFARLLGTEINDGRLDIPDKYGKGYCAGYIFNENIRMLILNYELYNNIEIKNPDINLTGNMLLFKFQNIIPVTESSSKRLQSNAMSSVLIGTSRMNTDAIIQVDKNTASINIEVDSNYLKGLFNLSEKSTVLKNLLMNKQPLLFEQMIYSSLQKIVNEILNESADITFKLLFLRIKAEELVYRLLMELEKRNEKHLYSLNIIDVQNIYRVREKILENLEIPPVIKNLAVIAKMSPSKLKRLFKQIFGNSIFNYYQEFRMIEAARLLKEEKISVSDAGYKMGFTNLSHFSRVFKEHIGMKPKQYSRS